MAAPLSNYGTAEVQEGRIGKMKRHCVGIIFWIMIDGVWHVLLRQRGSFNFVDRCWESRPFLFQVSCFGGINGGESLIEALIRELQEELGINKGLARHIARRMTLIKEIETETQHTWYFEVSINLYTLGQLKEAWTNCLHPLPIHEIPFIRCIEEHPSGEERFTKFPNNPPHMFRDSLDVLMASHAEIVVREH